MPEYIYECLCMASEHQHMCLLYNERRKQQFQLWWQHTGIAKHWRELGEGNQ